MAWENNARLAANQSMCTIVAIIYYNSTRFKQSFKMKVGKQDWHSAESTHLVLLLFEGHQKMARLVLKGVFQQNSQECSDFVKNIVMVNPGAHLVKTNKKH